MCAVINHADSCIASVGITRSQFKLHQMCLTDSSPGWTLPWIWLQLYCKHRFILQRCRRERSSWASSQPKVMTQAGGMPRSQKRSQVPIFVDLKRRKLFLLKDQGVLFFFWTYIVDESHSSFHMLPGLCFVSACCCVLPLLFNTSWSQFSDVFAVLKFGALDGMGAKGKKDWGVLAESESLQWASSAGLCCWPAV